MTSDDIFEDRELGISEKKISSRTSISSDKKHESVFTEQDGFRDDGSVEEEEEASIDENDPSTGVDPSSTENLTACLQVLGGFFLMFNSWGIANTFGAFQTFYEGALLSQESPSNISWIGSIQAFLLLLVGGICTGPIYDAGYLRELVLVGSISAVFGMMMTSICREYW